MSATTIEIARHDKYKITLTDMYKPSFICVYFDENGAVYTTSLLGVFRTELVDGSRMTSEEEHLLDTETTTELWGDQVVGLYPNGDIAFLLDASILIPKGHEHEYQLELTPLMNSWQKFALTVKKHGAALPYHLITDADMRDAGQETCGDTTISFQQELICAREVGHHNKHMSYSQFFTANWSETSMQFAHWGEFGIVRRCEYCDTPILDGAAMCFTCKYWHRQQVAPGGIVVRGNNFRSGLNTVFSDNTTRGLRNIQTGEEFHGPLANQGMIPELYRHMFPNTHEPLGQWHWPQDAVK